MKNLASYFLRYPLINVRNGIPVFTEYEVSRLVRINIQKETAAINELVNPLMISMYYSKF